MSELQQYRERSRSRRTIELVVQLLRSAGESSRAFTHSRVFEFSAAELDSRRHNPF